MSLSTNVSMSGQIALSTVSASGSLSISTGDNFITATQLIGISQEALTLPTDMTAAGMVLIKNKDATNKVKVGITGSHPIVLLPGQPALFNADGATIFALALVAPCVVEYTIIENTTTTTTTAA